MGGAPTPEVTAAQFRTLFETVRTWGRWGADDQRGAVNRLNGSSAVAAAGLVRSGLVLGLSLPLKTTSGPECPNPAEFRMTQGHSTEAGLGAMAFAKDFVGV